MKQGKWLILVGVLPFCLTASEVSAPAVEVMIFRSGNSLIRHEADPGGKAEFTVTGNFAPLEGTIWCSPNVKQIRKELTETEKKVPVSLSDITATYAGQKVTLHLSGREGEVEKVTGTVLDLFARDREKEKGGAPQIFREEMVTIRRPDGPLLSIARHRIVGVESASLKVAERTVRERRQAWRFTMAPGAKGKAVFDYITNTLNWIPGFKMELLPGKKMRLSCSATVVNSGDDLEKVKCVLWAGAPNLVNAGTFSPMAVTKPVPPRFHDAEIMRKTVSYLRNAASPAATEADSAGWRPVASGLSGNMAPFEAGTFSLKKGEALIRNLGSAEGGYENLIRWRIPPRQNDSGYRVWRNNADYSGNLWECLSFVNPFKRAMPEGTVEIADGSRVLAQVKTEWVNPEERATLEVARCRDVKGTMVERELPGSVKNRGEGVFQKVNRSADGTVVGGTINGAWFRVTDIEGALRLKNYRKTPARVVVELDYFGVFVSASGGPERKLLNHVGTLNPKHRLRWELTLKAGESRDLTYRYNIIVSR